MKYLYAKTLLEEHAGNKTAAARAAGVHPRTLGRWLEQDPAIVESMKVANTNLVPSMVWIKNKTHSIQLKPTLPSENTVVDLIDRLKDAFANVNATPTVLAPERTLDDLLTVYPVMDMHLGMRAWGPETGDQDYDLDLATQDVRSAFSKVFNLTPDSREAILILGGDTLHADDNRAETPASKHKLDVDGRHYRVLENSIALMGEVVESLLGKHDKVRVRVLRGNHDEHSHLVLSFALAERYRNEPRLVIERDPRDLFMYQWGGCAIFAHHGDKAKPGQLALYLSDVCPFWSETRHRHVLTGHVHHDQSKDLGPVRWESLRAFCPPDAYAASMGYGGRRALQALTFHKQDGLVLRAMDPINRV